MSSVTGSSKETILLWEDSPIQFRDPVNGYIGVPKTYVRYLIDTNYMQRLKNIAQSGIRSLFSSATHDRFSHSLGVYKFAMLAYKSIKTSMLKNLDGIDCKFKSEFMEKLTFWENLLSIASLLHDIGHPVGSHSFEFLYDDIFLRLGEDRSKWIDLTEETDAEQERERVASCYKQFYHESKSYKKPDLKDQLYTLLKLNGESVAGNPHERMSAYLILKDDKLNEAVRSTIRAYHTRPELGMKFVLDDKALEDAVYFICRMITGQTYPTAYTPAFNSINFEHSMRNCIIRVLNGVLDADSIDYITRNSYSAGYATQRIDYERLCSAFSTVRQQNTLESCFAKSALSVIEGFIAARNFEPKWLYSHHKVVYHDVLLKSLFLYTAKYLCYIDNEKFIPASSKPSPAVTDYMCIFFGNNNGHVAVSPSSAATNCPDATELEPGSEDHLSELVKPYYTYLLAPWLSYKTRDFCFHMSVDSHFDAVFSAIRLMLDSDVRKAYGDNSIFNDSDRQMLICLLQEHLDRKYKKSLWKSHAEYKLAMQEVADQIGLPLATICDYMMDLIKYGLQQLSFSLPPLPHNEKDDTTSPKDRWGNKIRPDSQFPETYEEQYIYVPWGTEEPIPSTILEADYARKHAVEVFSNFPGEYDFSATTCVAKVYKAKFKDFRKLAISINGKAHPIANVIDIPHEKPLEFPYIYFSVGLEDADAQSIRRCFLNRFYAYCSGKVSLEIEQKRGSGKMNYGYHIIRDVIHGDIIFDDRYWAVVNTREFQRLRRIRQLATASQVFPNAQHTRFSHCIGTYHIMGMIVNHFKSIFQHLNLEDRIEEDADVALLAALLHDLGHGPNSHAFEHILKNDHEHWTKAILSDEGTDVHKVIVERFGRNMPGKVIDCIEHREKTARRNLNFFMIYSGLVSGSLDADRMDYLMRDAYNTASQFGIIDIQSIIAAMRITQIQGVYRVCYDEVYLPCIEQLIFARYEMYDNVYFQPYKMLTEHLMRAILTRANEHRDKLSEHSRNALSTLFAKDGISVNAYLQLDDTTIDCLIAEWMNQTNDLVLKEMCCSFINRSGYVQIHVMDDLDANFLALFDRIEHRLGIKLGKANACLFAGLLRMSDSKTAYPDDGATDSDKVIWIMKRNGVTRDFRDETRLLHEQAKQFWPLHKSFAFFHEALLQLEFSEHFHTKAPEEINAMIEEVKRCMKDFSPKSHIEIEEKYLCEEQTLSMVEALLAGDQQGIGQFYLSGEIRTNDQEDVYYDTPNRDLQKNNCTLRIRRIKNEYTCTVKLPVDEKNFGGDSQFARYEYEKTLTTNHLADFAEFINTHLTASDEKVLRQQVTSENIDQLFREIITIRNRRKKGMIKRKKVDDFLCEICLDSVTYAKDAIACLDYQIEVELKSDYLHHVVLKEFTNLLERACEDNKLQLTRAETSKYQRGVMQLETLT